MRDKRSVYLSLGAGVQSSTLALMAAAGEVKPMPKAAIFEDTQAEPEAVYRWLDWLEQQLPYPVFRVTAGSLTDATTQVCEFKSKTVREKDTPRLIPVSKRLRKTDKYLDSLVPAFALGRDGAPMGMLQRRCTSKYKIIPVIRKLRELGQGENVIQWIGISWDEIIRMKPARDFWIENQWPLVEKRKTRTDCLQWMQDHGYPKPPRSACVFCPYHGDSEWLRLKREDPEGFQRAVQFERNFQEAASRQDSLKGTPFLHSSLIPLDQVTFKESKPRINLFGNECEGMCGV